MKSFDQYKNCKYRVEWYKYIAQAQYVGAHSLQLGELKQNKASTFFK